MQCISFMCGFKTGVRQVNDDVPDMAENFSFTKEGKLEHENKYLQDRLTNLEVFKKNFFAQHVELIEIKAKLALYEQQIELEKIKNRITGLPESANYLTNQGAKLNEDLLEFFEDSFSAEEYGGVVASVFHSLEGLELDVALKIEINKETYKHCLDEECKVDNLKLLDHHKAQGEQVEHDDYVIFNLKNISLIARNLPVSKADKLSEIKDFIKIVCIAANSRIESLSIAAELRELHKNIYVIFKRTHTSFENMRDNFDDQAIAISELYLNFEKKLLDGLATMKLPEAGLKGVKLTLYEVKSELNLMLTSGMAIDESFLASIVKLEQAYSKKFAE